MFKKLKDGQILAKLVNTRGAVDERAIVKGPNITKEDKENILRKVTVKDFLQLLRLN